MNRMQKEAFVRDMNVRLNETSAVFLGDFRGVNVAQNTALRAELRTADVEMSIVKNTLFRRALVGTPFEGKFADELLTGPNAVILVRDVVGAAKALSKFLKEHEEVTFVVKGGALPETAISAEDVKQLASLPSREELIATFMAQLQSPLRKFAMLLNAPLRDFAALAQALARKKETSE